VEYLWLNAQVSLVSKDSPMLDGLDTASIEMKAAKVKTLLALECICAH
jgi:hypothetical protein